MRESREAANLADPYDEVPMPWRRVTDTLGSNSVPAEVPCFLGTVRPDGQPHSAGVGVAQYDGAQYGPLLHVNAPNHGAGLDNRPYEGVAQSGGVVTSSQRRILATTGRRF